MPRWSLLGEEESPEYGCRTRRDTGSQHVLAEPLCRSSRASFVGLRHATCALVFSEDEGESRPSRLGTVERRYVASAG